MDLDALRAFLAVADTGSLLAAAESLGLARSTLRRRLDDLEARTGVLLLHRGAQGATLTEAGEVIAARGRRILQDTSALLASVREVATEPSGLLRVALPMGLPPHAMLPIFAATRANHPQLAIEARFVEDPLGGLDEGFDIAFHLGPGIPSGPWITRVFLRIPEQLVASPAYLDRRGRPRVLADLAGHEVFAWWPPGVEPRVLPTADGGFPIEPTLVTADVHSLRQLALEGHGIAFVPDGGLPDPGAPPDALEVVLPGVVARECPVRVVVPEAMARSVKVRALQERVLAFLGEG